MLPRVASKNACLKTDGPLRFTTWEPAARRAPVRPGSMTLLAFIVGALAWSLSEYTLHRFVGHGRTRRREGRWYLGPQAVLLLFNEEHVHHHRDPLYFAPTWKKAVAGLLLVPLLGGVASLLVGLQAGAAFGTGYALTYVAYEVLHRRIHTHAPIAGYFAWMRRHHLHHHVSPKVNHGVTSVLWDVAFGTHEVAQPVSLHVKLAPKWLVTDDGALRPEFAREYRLVGRR